MDELDQPRPRWGWLGLAAIAAVVSVATVIAGLWAISVTVRTGFGSPWQVVTAVAGAALFWGWISGGAWRRAREPEPDPLAPLPVPRRVAYVLANATLALLVTGSVAVGLWAGITDARESARLDKVRTRLEVAARRVGLGVDDVEKLEPEWQSWLAFGWDDDPPTTDPVVELLGVSGVQTRDLVVGDGRAAVLFVPDEGAPCVVLDIDEHDIVSTRTTKRC